MTTEVRLDHTIVHVRDNRESAEFLADVLGLPAPKLIGGKFFAVRLGSDVSLDFGTTEGDIVAQHYAFAVSAADFDAILGASALTDCVSGLIRSARGQARSPTADAGNARSTSRIRVGTGSRY